MSASIAAIGPNGYARHADDHYSTPSWVVRAVAPLVVPDGPCSVLDPCAGEGALLREIALVCPWASGYGFELDKERASRSPNTVQLDALSTGESYIFGCWGRPDVIVTNPPYRLAMSFLLRALAEVRKGGTVAFLLRLNFLGAQSRAHFWKNHPCDVCILSRRPSFTPDGGTDRTEYAWFIFSDSRTERRWQILDP